MNDSIMKIGFTVDKFNSDIYYFDANVDFINIKSRIMKCGAIFMRGV